MAIEVTPRSAFVGAVGACALGVTMAGAVSVWPFNWPRMVEIESMNGAAWINNPGPLAITIGSVGCATFRSVATNASARCYKLSA